jgi:uncharacterized protein (DUF934 family)
MTKIWKETGFVDNDPWVVAAEGEVVAEGAQRLLPIAEFLLAAESSNDGDYGVLVAPADDVTALEPHLDRIRLIAVAFPAFSDGRAFSHASLVRDRLGYRGEVRAVGDVLIDQIPLMIRCGIDSFAVTNATAIRRLDERKLPGISLHYQPSTRSAEAGVGYSWRRKAS